jgi:hypothetical protein
MEKLIKDGKVAVLVSEGYGAGFLTWGAPIEAIFNPTLIRLIEQGDTRQAINFAKKTWNGITTVGIKELVIEWVPEGKEFIIDSYDGNETLMLKDEINWIKA